MSENDAKQAATLHKPLCCDSCGTVHDTACSPRTAEKVTEKVVKSNVAEVQGLDEICPQCKTRCAYSDNYCVQCGQKLKTGSDDAHPPAFLTSCNPMSWLSLCKPPLF